MREEGGNKVINSVSWFCLEVDKYFYKEVWKFMCSLSIWDYVFLFVSLMVIGKKLFIKI